MVNAFLTGTWQCHCGCKQGAPNPVLLKKLNNIMHTTGRSIVITCGYRCPAHNIKVGGAKNSYHTKPNATTDAADIKIAGMTVPQMIEAAEKEGFTGIGMYKNKKTGKLQSFIHVDVRPNKARWVN